MILRFALFVTAILEVNSQILSLEEHGSECALLLAGGARSSAFDHNINILRGTLGGIHQEGHTCITFDAVNNAYIDARKRIHVSSPKGEWKTEDIATVGELLLDISIQLARTYGLSYEDIEKGLPQIDTAKTLIREVCPPFLSGVECRPGKYRRSDGLCNNLEHPTWGAAMAPFQRLIGPLYADGINAPRISVTGRDLPLSRVVSRTLHPDDGFHDHAGTVMVIAWGQFMDHDFTLTGTPLDPINRNDPEECCKRPLHLKHPYCNKIRVPDDDYFYRLFNVKCIDFVRGFPSPRAGCKLGSRTQFNTLTGVIDGNTIYGVKEMFTRKLRAEFGGLLRMNPVFQEYGLKDLLPLKLDIPDEGCTRPNKSMFCFEAGEIRVNEQLVLTCMHTMLAREHNRLAGKLATINPHWDDETLFQEARRINVAIIQHITYNEFLPILLGKEVMEKFGLVLRKDGYWDGYDSHINPSIIDAFASAAFRFGHSLLPTAVERWSKAHKFIASKRLSDLIRRPYDLYRAGVFDEYLMGLMNQVAQAMDDSITQEVTNHLFKKEGARFGMDLVSFNMQRGREFGIPGYMEFRKFCGLPVSHTWEKMAGSMPNETITRYSSIFEHPADIDLWSGGVSERSLPGSMLGPTFACVIATQLSYIRRGDRFWYELPNQPSSFTPEQLQELRKAKLSRLICDNTDLIDLVQIYPMVLPDHEINPRVPCKSGIIPSIDLSKWADYGQDYSPHQYNILNDIPDTVEVVLPKDQGSLGFSIIGGTDHSCVPFGANEPGIFISHIVPGGIAATSGKLRMGDRILQVNGTDVTSATHSEAVMELLRPSNEIKLFVQHDPLPVGFQNIILVKNEGEKLGMCIKGVLEGQKGNPADPTDEGVFVSKINSSGAARRDGRLKVGMRILEVNGTSLLGAKHIEAVQLLRNAGDQIQIIVCKGYDKSSLIHSIGTGGGMSTGFKNHSRLGSRASETGSELSQSVSSLDRDDDDVTAQPQPHQHAEVFEKDDLNEDDNGVSETSRDVALINSDQSLVSTKEKSTQEKVLEIVRAAESLALGTHLTENVPPKSPVEHHDDKKHKTTTIVMSAHTLDTQPQVDSRMTTTSNFISNMHEPYPSLRKSSVDSILSDGKTSTRKTMMKNVVSDDEYVQLQPSQSRHQATNLDNYFNEKRVISSSIQTQVGTDLHTQSTQTTANNEPYSRRDIEDVDVKSDISSVTSRPSSRNTTTKADVVSTGTNTSTHQKSVSFDLGEFEYTPVYTEANDDESVSQQAVNAPTETAFDDGYEVPRCSPPALPTIEKSQKKGILRSSSPMSNTSTLERLSVSSYTRKELPSEPEINRENPFRKEFFTDGDRSDHYNIYEEIGASRQQKDDSSDSERIKEIKLRTNSYYENVLTNNQTTSKMETKFVSSENLSSDSEQKIPIKRPIFKSTGSLFGNRPANKPPVPPRPPNVKHADVVYNEGLKTIQNEMEHGDLVEYMMHNVETNTITVIKTDNNRADMQTYDFNDDLPLPPITSPPPGIRRNLSVERPKESPPPPPINLATMPSRNKLRSSDSIDPSTIEIVPAKYEVLPTPKRVQFVNENSLNNILVTEDTYRELMLQENELRNAISQSHTESKNIPIRQAPPPPPSQQSQQQLQQQQHTIIMPSNTSNISSPTGSLQRYQQTMMTPVLSHNQIFPQSQIVPVQYSHLPVPQQAGIFHTFQSPTPSINYSYQSPSTMSQSNIGGFMSPPASAKIPKSVSDRKRFFENAMEDQQKPSPKSEKVFSFLSKDEVEKLKQEDEKKMATLQRDKKHKTVADGYEDEEENGDGDLQEVSQFRRITPPSSLSPINTPSRIPIRTTGVEKKIRKQENNAGETTTKDERELSPLELRALKAQERSAWRQARMKSLEQDALQAQKMIQSMNELADDILDSKNEVETCQEKIISLELQDPNEMQITPSDEDSSSIITVRSNAENVTFTVDDEALNTPSKLNTFMLQHHHHHHHPNTAGGSVGSSTMQTIVEVVNPVISGDGSENKITIGRSSDCQYASLDYGDDADDADGRPELSLNDKMKNVLQELLEDDRVKMNLSRSLIGKAVDIDDDDDLDEFIDEENRTTNGNFSKSFPTHLLATDDLDTNKNVCGDTIYGTDDGKNSNLDDCQVYINPSAEVYFNESFAPTNEKLSEGDEKLKEKLLSELHVDEMRTANNDANNQDDESLQEVLETVLTETGKSTNNSGKKKKKKGKNKKK